MTSLHPIRLWTLKPDTPRDALTHAETIHQRRAGAARVPRYYAVLWIGTLIVSMGLTTAYLIAIASDSSGGRTPLRVHDDLLVAASAAAIMVGLMLFLHYLQMITRALQLGSSAIAREKQSRSWDLLLLTGVTASQIVLGKWRSTLLILWQQNRIWLVWRTFAIGWLGFNFHLIGAVPGWTPPSVMVLQFLCGILIGITFVISQMIFGTAVGILASSLTRRPATAYQYAFGLHLLSGIGCLCLTAVLTLLQFFTSRSMLNVGEIPLYNALLITFVAPLEGGTISTLTALSTLDMTTVDNYVLAIGIGNGFFLLLSWAALRLAAWLIRRQGALAG